MLRRWRQAIVVLLIILGVARLALAPGLYSAPPQAPADKGAATALFTPSVDGDASTPLASHEPFDATGADVDRAASAAALQSMNVSFSSDDNCGGQPRFSSVRCLDMGSRTFKAAEGTFGFTISNRSCMYSNVVFDQVNRKFWFHAPPTEEPIVLPPVALASRPYDLPILHRKRAIIRRKVGRFYEWTPEVRREPIPCDLPRHEQVLGYYTPIVAPWNYAHTLLCDLFSLFWQMYEHNLMVPDMQVVATSTHYKAEFPLPNRNKAFEMFSRRPAIYDASLASGVYSTLLAGSGTKSWSWVTDEYKASGSPALWRAFRDHLIRVTGAVDRAPRCRHSDGHCDRSRPVRLSICHKKDKRGVVNYDDAVAFAKETLEGVEVVLESGVGRSAREQVQMMIDADVYMCNEGTLATSLFLMPPGSAFVSLPLVYHTPHLHQRRMPPPPEWWRSPDMLRPDPRKNVGGNIDWFPPAIRWVHTVWYDAVPMNETKIQLPLENLRNYMPEFNIVLQRRRLVPLLESAVAFVRGSLPPGQVDAQIIRKHMPNTPSSYVANQPWALDSRNMIVYPPRSGGLSHFYASVSVSGVDAAPPPNYSINANLCRQLLQLSPSLATSFNSVRCYFGMSWLCEFFTNSNYRWRLLHGKWRLSKGRCGNNRSSVAHMGLFDPRESLRALGEYTFYTRDELAASYTTTDLGVFSATDDELDRVFPR